MSDVRSKHLFSAARWCLSRMGRGSECQYCGQPAELLPIPRDTGVSVRYWGRKTPQVTWTWTWFHVKTDNDGRYEALERHCKDGPEEAWPSEEQRHAVPA